MFVRLAKFGPDETTAICRDAERSSDSIHIPVVRRVRVPLRVAANQMRPNLIACLAILTAIAFPLANARAQNPPDFVREIAPLFEQHCIRCHQPGNKKGDISLATIADLKANRHVVSGKPSESALLELVASRDGAKPKMPRQGRPLSEGEVAVLRRWIETGADWPETVVLREKAKADASWWSLQPIKAPPPPLAAKSSAGWSEHPIDRFIGAELAEKKLDPNPPATRRILIRRVTYDLTGLPPTPADVEAFEADRSPDAYEKVVDRLLASPRYGEHWGRHWLDVVRFGESNGYERNILISNLWPFRDYIIKAFNDDRPFDQLVLEHLAGDVVGKGNVNREVGTAFLVCGPYDNVGNSDAVQQALIRANHADEMIRAVSETFLGLTVGCARCHDHKFDPISQKDYYALFATIGGVKHGDRKLPTDANAKDGRTIWVGQFGGAAPQHIYLGGDPQKKGPIVVPASLGSLDALASKYELSPKSSESERRLALAKWLIADDNPLTARVLANRLWHYHFGVGIVDSPSDFGWMGGRPSHPELLDWLAAQLKAGGWKLKPIHRLIVTSQTFRQSSAWREAAAKIDGDSRLLWRFPPRRLTGEEIRDSMLLAADKLQVDKMGGPGFQLYKYVQDNVATYHPLDKHGPETYRRSVYHQNARAARVDVLSDFDCPDPAAAAPRRPATTSPLQALALLNHSFVHDMAGFLAERVQADAQDPTDRVRRVYAIAYGRPPETDELSRALRLVEQHGLRSLCLAILNSNEFIFLR